MTTKTKLLLIFLLIVAVFLLGFVPQFLETRKARNDLTAGNARIAELENQLKLAELRDLSGLMLLETQRRNYGSASEHASRYFDKVRQIAASETPQGKSKVGELLNDRESVTTALAQVDNPASISTIQMVFERTYELTR